MSVQSVADLVRRCARERDPSAWEEFVRRFGGRLRGGVLRALAKTGGGSPAEEFDDLLQEVYCLLLDDGARRLSGCRGRCELSVGSYLGRVAENLAIDRLRAASAAKRGRDRVVRLPPHVTMDSAECAVDPSQSPEEQLLARERRRLFLARCREVAGRRSPVRDVRILSLAFLGGLTSREIADRLEGQVTASIVDSLVHRAKRRFARVGLRLPRRGEVV